MHAKPKDTDNSVAMARGKGGGDWGEVGIGRRKGDNCNSANNEK